MVKVSKIESNGTNETGPMELKSKSSQNRVPKQSLREDMSTERQAKNKKKQKARKKNRTEQKGYWVPRHGVVTLE